MKLTIDYGKSTQNVLVAPGLNGISGEANAYSLRARQHQ